MRDLGMPVYCILLHNYSLHSYSLHYNSLLLNRPFFNQRFLAWLLINNSFHHCTVTAGNTFILKPSERDPGAAMLLAELAMQAGLPK